MINLSDDEIFLLISVETEDGFLSRTEDNFWVLTLWVKDISVDHAINVAARLPGHILNFNQEAEAFVISFDPKG
jgi:hypothetical protein